MLQIILDIDGTLISDANKDGTYIARPHLYEFIKKCFEITDNVSIWTAASLGWYNKVYNKTLHPILNSLDKKFTHVFHRIHCKKDSSNCYTKQLHVLFEIPDMKFTATNTLIIDNSHLAFYENYHNGLHINTFLRENKKDEELLAVSHFLDYIKSEYKSCKDIRKIKKDIFRIMSRRK